MLTLKCLGSGSDGNCYLLSDENGKTLILDCGINVKDVKVALNFNLSGIVGVVISHGHSDHFKYYKDFSNMGCEVFTPHIKDKIRQNVECYPYSVQSFRLPHGESNSFGFLIRHIPTKETLLYMTDFEYCQYVFKACKINHYLIECNYQVQYVDFDAPNKAHKLMGHCSLDTCKTFLKTNYTYDMQNVILCHLGKGSTNPCECVAEVEKVLNPNVFVDYARPNTVYELTDKRLPFTDMGVEE